MMQELKFDKDFFTGGEIEGFFVEEKMRRAWAASLKVLVNIDEVCRKNNIRYFLFYGSLLGAVRHKGFIPWDDDIDIAMPRDDYMRFLEIAEAALPNHYDINSMYHYDAHRQPIAAVTNRKNIWEDKKITEDYYGCPFIVGVDVYPLNYVPRDLELKDVFKNLYMAAYDLAQNAQKYKDEGTYETILNQLCEITKSPITRGENETNQIWRLADRILMMFAKEECDSVSTPTGIARFAQIVESPKEYYEGTISMPFTGGVELPVPLEPEKVLENFYGPNFMTPIQYGSAHGYPFYARQEAYLNEKGIFLD